MAFPSDTFDLGLYRAGRRSSAVAGRRPAGSAQAAAQWQAGYKIDMILLATRCVDCGRSEGLRRSPAGAPAAFASQASRGFP